MATMARAAVSRVAGAVPQIEAVTVEDPREDEILVEMTGVGVCHTDMVMRDGHLPVPLPVVLGHEGSGVVRAIGAGVTDLAVGDHVVLSFMSCSHCASCDAHQPAYCHAWVPLNFFATRADGSTALTDATGAAVHSHVFGQSSFATHAVVNRRNAVKVDADLPLHLLGPLGCGIQTGAGAVLNSCRVRAGASVAVIGTGAVGISAIMAARIAGAGTVVALDINDTRIALAQELGATHGFRSDDGDYGAYAAAAGCAAGFDYIIDTTGIPAVVNKAILALAPQGELALVGAYPPGGNIVADATHLMSAGRVVRGVVEGGADPQRFIPELIGYYREGRFPFDRLVQEFPFEAIAEAIAAGESGRVVKPVVRFS
ncbi:NAD(P)-dependent alcohol dehydrogenase [Novosphingobium cyanobacteriorum]|uniref:NAD(P)-dependent alcohol dehydrogenase n=1 Tax=Novosphingobium cyanobacteriorum TaxID=3024215 RepID=A0ABT6CHI4_9SPHN|nr:NAD(P)-dependent alcohol dehydrogenase [Novosphingobium cyanobacteriorum]MDF8333388.1 NAD(P)-dependent alcohol dehydrogenase [Novosphingobium cyanobacteriorum]